MGRRERHIEEALGKVVRERRMQRGFTQEQLARPHFTKSYISSIEHGRIQPSLRALFTLAEALGESPSRLLAAVEAEMKRSRPVPSPPPVAPAPGPGKDQPPFRSSRGRTPPSGR